MDQPNHSEPSSSSVHIVGVDPLEGQGEGGPHEARLMQREIASSKPSPTSGILVENSGRWSDQAAAAENYLRMVGWANDDLDYQALAEAVLESKANMPGAEHAKPRLNMFLEILSAMGGVSDAGDYAGNWINAFCESHENADPDTFNLAIQKGFTTSTHCTSFDTATVHLTDAGRDYLASLNPTNATNE